VASHNHFLISERGQRKETMTEGQYESKDMRKRKREEGVKRGGKVKRMGAAKEKVRGNEEK